MSLQSDFAELARSGGRGALVTVLQGAAPGTRMPGTKPLFTR